MQTQTSIGNIVPGASFIEAIGSGISYEQYRPKYLSVAAEKGHESDPDLPTLNAQFLNWIGVPGPAVVHENLSPPLFYIYQQQLWQLTNQTSILRVNVLNTTDVEGHFAPLKLELGEKKEGVSGGIWRWRGTMLHYDLGQKSNKGLYYSCESKSGMRGVYMSIDP